MSITKESENGMSLLKFNDYLEFTQNRVKENGEPPTRIVLGNESADLDSTVCCLLTSYALFLREKETPSHALCLPVLPIPRRTFLLRKDIINYFTSLDLTWESLLYFLEDLDAWHGNPLKVILVDTNILPRPVASLSTKWSIESIFDHHEDQQLHLTASPRQVVPVMSATSLVVNEYFPFFQTKSLCPTTFTLLAQLALAPLLMDTHDWRTCTHTDTDAYQLCLPYLPTRNGSLNHSSMYTQLRTWKTEGPWTLTEWIEKDMK
ncbi:Exopolyphosphatase, partial [Coelomomyces lativittatus]